jgi:hypothetical protein
MLIAISILYGLFVILSQKTGCLLFCWKFSLGELLGTTTFKDISSSFYSKTA